MSRIAIIGGGNIGEALLGGLLRAGHQVRDLVLAEKVPERADYLSRTFSVRVASVAEAVENVAFVILAVKPADVESTTVEIANAAGDELGGLQQGRADFGDGGPAEMLAGRGLNLLPEGGLLGQQIHHAPQALKG